MKNLILFIFIASFSATMAQAQQKDEKKGKRTLIIKQEVDDDNNVVRVDTLMDQKLMDLEGQLKDINVKLDFDFDFDFEKIDSIIETKISDGDSVLKEMHIYIDKMHKEMAPEFEKLAQMHQDKFRVYINQVDSMLEENLKNIEIYVENIKHDGRQTIIIGEGKLNVVIDEKGEKLRIEYNKPVDKKMELAVLDDNDNMIFSKTIPKGSRVDEQIDISGYKEGPYNVRLKHNHLIILERIQVKH